MSKVVFFTWPGGGNQPPAIGLAQDLQQQGHTVSFAGYPGQVERFVELGLPLVPLTRSSQDWGPVDPSTVMGLLADRVWACGDHRADVEEVLARERPDLVVVDCLMLGVLAAAEVAAVPTVVLVHSAPGALAPPGGPFESMLLPAANALRTNAGLGPVASVWEAWRPHHVVAASIPELDPLAADVSRVLGAEGRFTWVGPVEERSTTPKAGLNGTPGSPPQVLVSFSTGPAWDQTSRIQRTIDALSGDGIPVLVTAGTVDIATLRIPADTVTVVPFMPHAGVLSHAMAVVTHAGHGTLTAALAHSLPVVTLPNQAADQPALAHQVARLGAGVDLDGDGATPAEIHEAVQQVLHAPVHREAATALASQIRARQATQAQLSWLPGPS